MKDTRLLITQRHAFELAHADSRLMDLLLDCAKVWPEAVMEITDLARTEAEEVAAGAKTRIHSSGPPWRACDIRVITLGPDNAYTMEDKATVARVCARLNAMWSYDDARPQLVCAYSQPHGTGPHIHLQVHERTWKTGIVSA